MNTPWEVLLQGGPVTQKSKAPNKPSATIFKSTVGLWHCPFLCGGNTKSANFENKQLLMS